MDKEEKMTKKAKTMVKQKRVLLLALALLFFVLFLVMFIRLINSNPVFPLGESYYNLRVSEAIAENPLLTEDSVHDTLYEPNPYHYFLALSFRLLPFEIVSVFLPLILGILSALMFFSLLKAVGVRPMKAAYSIILLVATPAFITLFTGLYISGFAVFLSLLALLLALKKGLASRMLAVLVFIILALTSIIGFLITLIILFLLFIYLKRNVKTASISLFLSIIGIILATLLSNYVPRLAGFHPFAFREVFAILKAGFGYDLFFLILFVAGFILVWMQNKEKNLFHLPVLLFVVLSFFNSIMRVYASIMITMYCVVAITYFCNRKWQLNIVRAGTLLLILCSLVFSATNQINILIDAEPKQDVVNALSSLRILDKGAVLTHAEFGSLVGYYSDKNALLNSGGLSRMKPELENDALDLFMVARLIDAEPILESLDIRYIMITPEMKESLWESQERGLWFLMINSESFIKKYAENGIEIWEYKPVKQEAGG